MPCKGREIKNIPDFSLADAWLHDLNGPKRVRFYHRSETSLNLNLCLQG
jgi:hypothetical protein